MRAAKPKVGVRKLTLDLETAASLGMSHKRVRSITTAFLLTVVNHLVDDGQVHIDGLGSIRVSATRGSKRLVTLTTWKTKGKVMAPVPVKYYMRLSKARCVKLALMAKGKENPAWISTLLKNAPIRKRSKK